MIKKICLMYANWLYSTIWLEDDILDPKEEQ